MSRQFRLLLVFIVYKRVLNQTNLNDFGRNSPYCKVYGQRQRWL